MNIIKDIHNHTVYEKKRQWLKKILQKKVIIKQ